LIGNVWEWTSTYHYEKGTDFDIKEFWNGEPDAFKGTDSFILRGGGWEYYYGDDVAPYFTFLGIDANGELGIRCVADIK
jgi:formylglycine-generating enzyme required for sulfatase activity